MFSKAILLVVATASMVSAQSAAYGQCGGQGFSGSKTCVSGWTCTYSNAWYSQCLPGKASSIVTSILSSTSAKAPAPVSTSSAKVSTPTSAPAPGGVTYKASFTQYGAGDTFGSGNCNTATAACGFYTSPGFNAAASQNLFGVGPGAGAGPACGTCWQLTPKTDSSGNALSGVKSIIVKVNNLCPADGNPLCAQNGLSGTNQYGMNVNFDTCIDDGASAALFGSSGVGLALGSATQVNCKQWSGSANIL